MSIKLLRFPFLIQRQIFEEMSLLEALFISMLSRRSEATVKACLHHHQYSLEYTENETLVLKRQFPKADNVKLSLALFDQNELEYPYQWWNMGNQERVPIRILTGKLYFREIITVVQIYCQSKSDFALKTLQRLAMMLPKLSLTLKFRTLDTESFQKILQSIECVNKIKGINTGEFIRHRNLVPQDELVKLILDNSQRTKRLHVTIPTSNNFEYPLTMPFKFDSISIFTAGWVSRDHLIKLFLSCKKVELHQKNFNDEDLTAIFKAWTEGSPLEFLQFFGTDNFYQGKTLDSIFDEFPEAAPVRNAKIPTRSSTGSHVVTFGEGECFLIQQNDGQATALVYIVDQSVMLSTNFQNGKEVDEMAVRIEEERIFRQQHPIDENLEEEEDDD